MMALANEIVGDLADFLLDKYHRLDLGQGWGVTVGSNEERPLAEQIVLGKACHR